MTIRRTFKTNLYCKMNLLERLGTYLRFYNPDTNHVNRLEIIILNHPLITKNLARLDLFSNFKEINGTTLIFTDSGVCDYLIHYRKILKKNSSKAALSVLNNCQEVLEKEGFIKC